MGVRWDAVADDWLAAHHPTASAVSRQALRALLSAARAAGHKEAVREAETLDAEIAGKLAELLAESRSPRS